MDKLKMLVDLLHDNKLNESNQLLEEIIKDKLIEKLAEKKVQIASSMMFEDVVDEQITPEQIINRVQRRKWHNLSMHAHQARDKNLSDRQGLENKLKTLSTKRFK